MTFQPAPPPPAIPPNTEPPLDQPWYGIGFMDAFKRTFKKYATFSGRAGRGEYWWWFLANILVGIIPGILIMVGAVSGAASATKTMSGGMGFSIAFTGVAAVGYILSLCWGLATFIPSLAVTWRRLHDTGKSGGWFFILLVPLAGSIILLVLLASDSTVGGAQWDRLNAAPYAQPQAPGGYPPPQAPQG